MDLLFVHVPENVRIKRMRILLYLVVFSLDKMMFYENIPGEDVIGYYPKFGPIFLKCQIRIYDNAFSKGVTTF